jgi:subtilisin-like proprotein convertase family protein
MKYLFIFLMFINLIFFSPLLFSQNNSDQNFRIPYPEGKPPVENYSRQLLEHNINYKNPNTVTHITQKDGQYLAVAPNFRPFPSSVSQSEVEAANMKGNDQVIYAAWNNLTPSLGVGYCYSSDGGVTWIGNSSSVVPSQGDPGTWIWPAGTPWAGRLGLSFINGAGYSTNQGSSWVFATSFLTSNYDKNLSAVDDVTGSPFFGRCYNVWSAGSPQSGIWFSFSSDGGVTWSTPSQVSPPATTRMLGCDIESGPGGIVYVVWANFSQTPFTEDSLGFAKSTDGGVSWAVSVNNAVNINGIFTGILYNGFRANGVPRLAVDNTGGTRNGWIYVTTGEKTIAPATDSADVCLCRSTDGGASWTHTRVNQDTPGNGKYQYFGDIDVVPDGSVVTAYYDQRNTTGSLTEFWISRSTDGGNTWVDAAVSDHSFTPVPIIGTYQGDYTGITTAAGKIWPFWMDNSSGIYQVWTAAVSYQTPPVSQQTKICRTGLNKNIIDPPDSGLYDTLMLNITGAVNVIDVNVSIDTVLHTFDSDLRFTLMHSSQSAVIIDRVGGGGNNFLGTYLNDSVSRSLSVGTSPFSDKFKPSTPLSVLNNTAVNGPWIMHIQDLAPGDTGFLKQWCIVISYQTLLGNIETVEIPSRYLLKQNYPNPFNPKTKIKYGIPKSGLVTLKIYDLLGKEITTLVNTVKEPGTYTVDFDASGLSSGVYFYRIESGEFTEIKKMVLLK